MIRRMGRIGAAFAAVLLLAGCASTPADDAKMASEGKYLTDLDVRGVPTGGPNGAPPKLGHAICNDIGSGSAASAAVLQVANLQLGGNADVFTTPQAEEIVYWAVTELCPQYSSQVQAHWRNGT